MILPLKIAQLEGEKIVYFEKETSKTAYFGPQWHSKRLFVIVTRKNLRIASLDMKDIYKENIFFHFCCDFFMSSSNNFNFCEISWFWKS